MSIVNRGKNLERATGEEGDAGKVKDSINKNTSKKEDAVDSESRVHYSFSFDFASYSWYTFKHQSSLC